MRTQETNLDRHNITSSGALFLATALCVGVVFVLAVQSLPRADDFCRAHAAPLTAFPSKANIGIVDYGWWSYFNWTGRWASTAFETFLLSSTPQPKSYPWLLLLVISGQFFLVYLSVKQFVYSAYSAFGLAALFACVYWANLPSVQQGMFWITGSIENQLSVTLAILLFSILVSPQANDTPRSKLRRTILACVLGLLVPALHELLGGITVLILSAILIRAIILKSPDLKGWAFVWAAAVIGFLIVFLAPGNAIRESFYPNRTNFRVTVKFSLDVIRLYLLPWCLDFKHWLLALLLWIDPRAASLRQKFAGLRTPRSIGLFFCIWLSVLLIGIIATTWKIGQPPPPRTMNLMYGMFLAGWIVTAFLLTRPILSFSLHGASRLVLRSIILMLLAVLIASSGNTLLGMADILHGRTSFWNTQLHRRFTVLRSSRGTDVQVAPLSVHPLSYIGWDDVTEDPDNWSNQCVAGYFGVDSVRIPTHSNSDQGTGNGLSGQQSDHSDDKNPDDGQNRAEQ